MPTRKPFNQLDPFEENKDQFQTREIRNSRSRSNKNPFINVSNQDGRKSKHNLVILYIILIAIIIVSVVLLLFSPRTTNQDPTVSDDPLVNPTGREASSEYSTNTKDPELHAREQNKLNTLLELAKIEDWEYANATFETIFPDYLDTCERYDYYRLAILLADNFEDFTISRETAETRMNYLLEKCSNTRNE